MPAWTPAMALALSGEVSAMLASERADDFLRELYGDEPRAWHDGLAGFDRLRVIVNACTRMRFCTADGTLEFRRSAVRKRRRRAFARGSSTTTARPPARR
jgi:bis(5'-nucleosyl)-tetraphosphatase (symmetrical)